MQGLKECAIARASMNRAHHFFYQTNQQQLILLQDIIKSVRNGCICFKSLPHLSIFVLLITVFLWLDGRQLPALSRA